MTPERRWVQGKEKGVPVRGEPPAVQWAKYLDSCLRRNDNPIIKMTGLNKIECPRRKQRG